MAGSDASASDFAGAHGTATGSIDGSGSDGGSEDGVGRVGSALSWSNANFVIGGKESKSGQGGGFEIDPESADSVYKGAAEIANQLTGLRRRASRLRDTEAPADDPGSSSFNSIGNAAFARGEEHVKAEAEYWRSLAKALGDALEQYRKSDEQSQRDMKTSGGDGGSGDGGFM